MVLRRKKRFWIVFLIFLLLLLLAILYRYLLPIQEYDLQAITKQRPSIGQAIDSLDGVYVYYNGFVSNVEGRNTVNGYNLGLKYQCVEFVKRYYYQHYKHKMPDPWGHAKDFFQKNLGDGKMNTARNLIQFTNPSSSPPRKGDLLVFKESRLNSYGHVAIVAQAKEDAIVLIQQNPGPLAKSRIRIALSKKDAKYQLEHSLIVGWLRKK
jgi:surface antigen